MAWNIGATLLYLGTIFSIALTQSRMAWVCCFLCALVWLWKRDRRPAWLTAMLVLLPAFVFGADYLRGVLDTPHAWQASSSRLVSNEHPRLALWMHVIQMIAAKPWFGWGWNEVRFAQFETLVPQPYSGVFDHTHNLFLELALSFGIPVAVIAALGMCALVFKARPWQETRPVAIMAWLILACLFVYSMLEFPLWSMRFVAVTGLCVGILCAHIAQPFAVQAVGKRVLLTSVIWAITILAMLDYQWASRAFGSSAIWRVGPEGSLPHVIAAQRTVLFSSYTSFAIVASPARKHLSDEQIVQYGEHALHYAPEPVLLSPLIAAHQRLGHMDRVNHLSARSKQLFPAHPLLQSLQVNESGQP